MIKIARDGKSKAGLPPGSMVYVGSKPSQAARITVFDYDAAHMTEKVVHEFPECVQFKDSKATTWINVDSLADTELISKLDSLFGVHPLVLEDIVNTGQRPKMEDYDQYIFIVLKMLYFEPDSNTLTSEQLSLVVGDNYLLSFQEREGDYFDNIRGRIRHDRGRIRKMGPDYLAYALLDTIVDNYFIVLERFESDIARIEDRLTIGRPVKAGDIHTLKRNLIYLRKQIAPVRELVAALQRVDSELIRRGTSVYWRDLYDHTISAVDTIESFRDVVSGLHDIYLSGINLKMNEIMKVLTVISTVFIPLTFIAGVYGMNFKHMPELEWIYGYPAVLIFMLMVMMAMFLYFIKKRWL